MIGLAQPVALKETPLTRKWMLEHLDAIYAWGQAKQQSTFVPVGELRGRPAEAHGPSMSTPINIPGEVEGSDQPQLPRNTVIGIICAGDLAVHRAEVKAAISRGITERPDAIWVCIEPRSDRMTHDLMISLDIEPVVLPMNPAWQYKASQPVLGADCPTGTDKGFDALTGNASYDLRRQWRDLEMLHLCDQLVIFHKASGNSPWRDRVKSGLYDQRLYLVEIGTSSPKKSNRPNSKEYTT